jgi:hypothetical protein
MRFSAIFHVSRRESAMNYISKPARNLRSPFRKFLPSFYPVKRVKKGRTVKLCVSRYSEMVAVDAVVVCIQSTPSFPSWTSRVRSPSPALVFKSLALARLCRFR